ncbi:MAG: NAD(P)/FAD-dependent oxidoreductase [Chloroflexi bacterium]|nr:NAD(P)/FAD-dependent oxidoreductase [Chloroflexota bacterium]
MRIGIVGGGMLGLSLAYFLSKSGHTAIVFEGKDHAGGLLDVVQVGDAWIDKYYHCILGDDVDLLALVDELGLAAQVRFQPARQGFFSGDRLYPMSSGKDLLLFPPLSLFERVRLGLTILAAFRIDRWDDLEQVAVEDWLVGLGGRGAFDKVWKPLLQAKFDAHYDRTPATYIWSRIKRTSSTRAAAGRRDRLGYFVGSYKILVDRLVERIEQAGSAVRTGARVQAILLGKSGVDGVQVGGTRIPLDAVVVTTPLPALSALVSSPQRDLLHLPPESEYLGVICGLLLLDRSLSPYYTLNIADEDIPFTGVIETTNVIAPEHVGGHHLVYVPKYVTRSSAFHALTDDALRELYVTHLSRMFPAFRESWIRHAFVFRERFVEPLHQIGRPRPSVPTTTAIDGLFVVNNGQIYPELTNCQASVRHATRSLPTILSRHAGILAQPPALATN